MPNNPKSSIPDAWDDEWEAAADRAAQDDAEPKPEAPPEPVTRRMMLAKHEETNRKLWEDAEAPREPFYFLQAQDKPVFATPSSDYFRPPMKVLSRAPNSAQLSGQTVLPDSDDLPSAEPSSEEVRRRQEKEREEKQRRYDEARARIFGTSPQPQQPILQQQQRSSGGSPQPHSRERGGRSGRGRGRGGYGGRNSPAHREREALSPNTRNSRFQRTMSPQAYVDVDAPRKPSAPPSGRALYDPNASSRPQAQTIPTSDLRREDSSDSGSSGGAPIRQPRLPDGTKGFNTDKFSLRNGG